MTELELDIKNTVDHCGGWPVTLTPLSGGGWQAYVNWKPDQHHNFEYWLDGSGDTLTEALAHLRDAWTADLEECRDPDAPPEEEDDATPSIHA